MLGAVSVPFEYVLGVYRAFRVDRRLNVFLSQIDIFLCYGEVSTAAYHHLAWRVLFAKWSVALRSGASWAQTTFVSLHLVATVHGRELFLDTGVFDDTGKQLRYLHGSLVRVFLALPLLIDMDRIAGRFIFKIELNLCFVKERVLMGCDRLIISAKVWLWVVNSQDRGHAS